MSAVRSCSGVVCSEEGDSGVVVVGEPFTKYFIRSGASDGVTWSTKVNAGRMRTVVGWFPSLWW